MTLINICIYKYIYIYIYIYIDELDNIVNKYSNTYRSTIKMKPVDVKSSTYIGFDKKDNKEDPKFKDNDHVRKSKYKNFFAKVYVPNWSEEVFVIKKVNTTEKKSLERFTKKNCEKQI